MMRRFPDISTAILILFLAMLFGCTAKQKNSLEIPEGLTGIISYGSLISVPSMEKTLGHKYEGPIHEVHLLGYERVWTCVRPWDSSTRKFSAYVLRGEERVPILGAAELNIYPKKTGKINGVLYLITDDELLSFDQRERGYQRVEVTEKIEEFSFSGGKVYVYEGLPGSPLDPSEEKGIYILIKEFFDMVNEACDSRGEDFRKEFDRTTRPCEYEVVPYENIIWEKDN